MPLIKSISGIRGTIGGPVGKNLTPIDIVECTAAFGYLTKNLNGNNKFVVGRDARISGPLVMELIIQTLIGLGCEVVDLDLSTTPTVEMAVKMEGAGGGIIVTASHNPKQWNALKFLNDKGEFISAETGQKILDLIESKSVTFASVDELGTVKKDNSYIQKHIDKIFELPLVNAEAIRTRSFKVVIDCINSTGSISMVPLLEQMGCEVISLFDDLSGDFSHNPEPLPKHLSELSKTVISQKADLGISVDPDVDRLALVCEDGSMFGEEYTLVAVADYVVSLKKGNTVSNLSSTRALKDLTFNHGAEYFASAVGEVNVVNKMKQQNAVIGGEGNGGIIYPELHYGRDSMVGIALFLSHLAQKKVTMSSLKKSYPEYYMSKDKIALTPSTDVERLLVEMESRFKEFELNKEDGLKIDLPDGWIHLRKSNTEPIIRIYTEGKTLEKAQELGNLAKKEIEAILSV